MKINEIFKKINWFLFGPSDEFIILTQNIENIQADFKRKFDELNDAIDNHRRYMYAEVDFLKAIHDHQINELTKIPVEKQVIRKPIKCCISTAPKNKPIIKRVK